MVVPSALIAYSSPQRVLFRDHRLELDNGSCRGTTMIQFFTGLAPTRTADCKPNEVEVPNEIGVTSTTSSVSLRS